MSVEISDKARQARRVFLLGMTLGGLSACGFQPRGTQVLPPALRKVSLNGSQPGSLTLALTLLLQQNGAEIISTTPMPADGVSLRLGNIQLNRREALTDRQANLRQIELILRVQLDASHADGRAIIEHEHLEAVRSTSYNPLSLLAQGEEEQRLQRELDEQMAHTLLARVKSAVGNSAELRSKAAP